MKSLLTRTLPALIVATAAALAQDSRRSPAAPDADGIKAQVQQQVEMAQAQADQVRQQAQRAQAQAEQALALAQADVASIESPDALVAPVPPRASRAVMAKIGRPAPAKALVIRTSSTDDKMQSNLEEDLSVMARILQKAATRDSSDEEGPQASGIPLFFAFGGDSPHTLYLEGYGALFLLNVRFPLLPPPAKAETAKAEAPTNSTWDEARRELYGATDEWDVAKMLKIHPGREKPLPYDASKVERLQRALLEALRNASNIRNLQPGETVTLCVFGGASARELAVKNVKFSDEGNDLRVDPDVNPVAVVRATDRATSAGQQTVLTIRVKKADADAFAKGDLDLDAFTKRAQITSYTTESGGWGRGPSLF